MITFALVILFIGVVIGLFVPDKYIRNKRPRRYRRKSSNPKRLPWFDSDSQRRNNRNR